MNTLIKLPRRLVAYGPSVKPLSKSIRITATFSGSPLNFTLRHAAAPMDSDIVFLFTKDDGYASDYTIVYPIIMGGLVNGTSYPGLTYDDGTGKKRPFGVNFALNGGKGEKDGINTTSWAQYQILLAETDGNFSLGNHSYDHASLDRTQSADQQLAFALQELDSNHVLVKEKLNYVMRNTVTPQGDPMYALATKTWNASQSVSKRTYLGNTSEGYLNNCDGLAGSDFGDSDPAYWYKQAMRLPLVREGEMLCQRFNIDNSLITGTSAWNDWLDQAFQFQNSENKPVAFCCFAHHPFGTEDGRFDQYMRQILLKAQTLGKRVAVPCIQEFFEWFETKRLAVLGLPIVKGNQVVIDVDLSAVPIEARTQNLSLILTGGSLTNVQVSEAYSANFNPQTGLINLYQLR